MEEARHDAAPAAGGLVDEQPEPSEQEIRQYCVELFEKLGADDRLIAAARQAAHEADRSDAGARTS